MTDDKSTQTDDSNDDQDKKFLVRKLSNRAQLPLRKSKEAAGFDIFSAEEIKIPAGGTKIVRSDLQVQPPREHI